jgi:phenylpropionate dioxygenase-like ring-hydroxylating dioxygenase large terminal subunit
MQSECTATGNCYEAGLTTLMRLCSEGDESHYRLVHAEIIGQGPIDDLRHGHAFVVDVVRDVAYDESNGKNVCWPLPVYAAIARMHEVGNWHMYTLKEASLRALDTGEYGPWDLVTSTGL